MQVFNSQGETTLLSSKSILRLTETGSVSPSSQDGEGYFYETQVNLPNKDDPFFFCVQSEFDKIAFLGQVWNSDGNNLSDIQFFSTLPGPKNYRLYTTFNFSSYTIDTNYGMQLFGESGNVIYDSRVPEAIYIDLLNIPASTSGSINHKAISDCWYPINTFPASFEIISSPPVGEIFFRGIQQVSSTESKVIEFDAGLITASGDNTGNAYQGLMPIITSLGLD